MTKRKNGEKPSYVGAVSALLGVFVAAAAVITNWAAIYDRFHPGEIEVRFGTVTCDRTEAKVSLTNLGRRPVTIESTGLAVVRNGLEEPTGIQLSSSPNVIKPNETAVISVTARSVDIPIEFPLQNNNPCRLEISFRLISETKTQTAGTACNCPL